MKQLYLSLLFHFILFAGNAHEEVLQQLDAIKALAPKEQITSIQKLIDQTDKNFPVKPLAQLYHDLGLAYYKNDNIIDAIEETEKAFLMREELAHQYPNEFLTSSFNLGVFYTKINAFQQALNYFEHILSQGTNSKTGATYYQMGRIYTQLGEFHLAEQAFSSAAQLPPFSTSAYQKSNLFMEWSVILIRKDTPKAAKRAIHLLESAYSIVDSLANENSKYHPKAAFSLFRLATAQIHAGNFKTAIQILHKALQRDALIGKRESFSSYVYTNLGIAHRRLGNYAAALKFQKKAQAINLKQVSGKPNDEIALNYDNLASIYFHQGYYQKSLEELQKALSWVLPDFRPTTVQDNPSLELLIACPYKTHVLTFLTEKAKAWQKLGKKGKNNQASIHALNTYKRCDALIDLIRADHFDTQTKLEWRKQAKQLYQEAVKLCLHSNYLEEAFYFSEKSRAVLLLDRQKELDTNLNLPKEMRQEVAKLSATISFLEKRIFHQNQETDKAQLLKTKQQYQQVLKSIKKEYPTFQNITSEQDFLSLKQVKQALKEDQTLIEYFIAEDFSLAFVINSGTARMIELGSPKMIEKNIETLLHELKDYTSPFKPGAAYQLHQQLIDPLTISSNNHLIIIPDGLLGLIPFEVLLEVMPKPNTAYVDWSFFFRKQAIQYAFSANFQFGKKSTTASGNGKVLALAPMAIIDTSFGITPDLELPASKTMVEMLNATLPTELLLGNMATRGNFEASVNHASLLHLATHFYVNHEQPEFSYFLLADSVKENRRFYAHDLYNSQFNTDLVVLSACETGTGKLNNGEGIASLGRDFAYNGCPNITMSLWLVDDQSTADLLAYFYSNLNDGQTTAKALHQARLNYMKEALSNKLNHPFRWAGMVYYGRDTNIEFKSTSMLSPVFNYLYLFFLGGFLYIGLRKLATSGKNQAISQTLLSK